MRCLAGTKWGAALRNVYTALIRSAIEYGLIVYGSAAYSSLQKIDRVQAQALRICCGAVRSTPVSALQVEVGEIPIFLRRKQLIVNYRANLQGHKDTHRTKQTVKTSWESNKMKKESVCVSEFKVKEWNISQTVLLSAVPPWLLPQPIVDVSLLKRLHSMKNKINVQAYCEYCST